MNKRSVVGLLVAVTALVSAACGDGAAGDGTNNNNITTNTNTNDQCPGQLAFDGSSVVFVQLGLSKGLRVRYEDCDARAVADAQVTFEIVGDAAGSQLSALTAQTGSDGIASVILTGGATDTTFQVTATAPEGSARTFEITVTGSSIGYITVEMIYSGDEPFNSYTAYLFQGVGCGDLAPFALPTAYLVAAPVAQLTDRPQFANVPTSTGYAVAVVAEVNGATLGFGCVNTGAVVFGEETIASVVLGDIPLEFDGVYDLDNHFDLTGALPPSVATVVNLFDEMTDDNDVNGNPSTEDFGQDPAAFLLDFVYRQFCCWEATGSNPDWDSCTAQTFQHDAGDLSAIYLQNFQSWDGAQPRAGSWGLCGALEMGTNEYLQTEVQSMILATLPDVVLRIANIAGDLSRAITQMHLYSILTLDHIAGGKFGPFTHELVTMEVELHNLNGTLQTYQFDLAAAGLTNLAYTGSTSAADDVLNIPVHSFDLDFGKLLEYIYLNGILPLLGYTSTAEMFQDWINCVSVGTWLEAEVGWFSASQYEQYCIAGLNAAGAAIEDNLHSVTSTTTTFTIEGSCAAGEVSSDRVATTLINGVWNGSWSENGQSDTFTGTFTGTRQ
jgi:hypothetical protein